MIDQATSNPFEAPRSFADVPKPVTIRILRVNVKSVATTTGAAIAALMFVGGFIACGVVSVGLAFGEAGLSDLGLVFAAMLIGPIIYGVTGMIAGTLGACVFNLVANSTGGFEIEIASERQLT